MSRLEQLGVVLESTQPECMLTHFVTAAQTRGQPATIIPRPASVIEILQGAYFPEVLHSVLQ